MSDNQFVPNFVHGSQIEINDEKDPISNFLLKSSQYFVLAIFFLIPIFFTPQLWASFNFAKVIVALVLGVYSLLAIALLSLRLRGVKTVLPIPLGLYWLLVIIALISALYNEDILSSIRGSAFGVQTVGFMALVGLIMTVTLVLQNSKKMTMKAILLFGGSATLVLLYNFLRLFFGSEFLSFGTFSSLTVSPVGSFNDLAVFSGLLIVLGLITLSQLPLNTWLQLSVALMVIVSLFLLAVINFFNIWLVIGLFSLLMLVYLLSRKGTFSDQHINSDSKPLKIPITIISLVFFVSATFVVAGEYASGIVNKIAQVDYAEVVPSRSGTLGIAKAVYETSPLLGIGPNRFSDAWRLHKDPSINQTIFWDTDFSTGSGYVSTLFVTVGVLGGLTIIAFHLWFLYLGFKILVRNTRNDSYWYYVGSVSFAASAFLWGMMYVYEPNATLLLITAMFSGLTFVAAGSLVPEINKDITLVTNQKRGFFIMAFVTLISVTLVATLLVVGKQYVAQANFNQAQSTTESLDQLDLVASNSYNQYPDTRFLRIRTQIQLNKLSALLAITEPTEDDRQRFLSSVELAQSYINQAINNDPTDPDNYALLAGIYGALAVAGIDGAKERTISTLDLARKFDPTNPGYDMVAALTAARANDLELAKERIESALILKPNFTEALFLSAQIDISEGNAQAAIDKTKAIISLEPQNPTRYFQLGLLLSSEQEYDLAIAAFTQAIALDSQYANARYMLALALLATDQKDQALVQLKIAQQTNKENEELKTLIDQIESGEVSLPALGLDVPVTETVVSDSETDDETGSRSEETNLVENLNSSSDRRERDEEQTEGTDNVTESETIE